jgi:MFS transporter, DHA3 family, macrolide efflux protein
MGSRPDSPGSDGESRGLGPAGRVRSSPWWPVVTHPALRSVLPGLAVSCLGDGMAMVAVPLLALHLVAGPHQGWAVAAAVVCYTLPGAVAVPALRRLLDRRDGAQLAGWDATLRAVVLGAIPLAAVVGSLTLPVYAGLLASSSLLHVWGTAGRYTLIAKSLPDEHRVAANGLMSAFQTAGYVAGPAIAGGLLAVLNPAWIIGIDAVTFAVLAATYRCAMAAQGSQVSTEPTTGPRPGGFRTILSIRQLLGLTALTALFFLLYGPIVVALPITVSSYSHHTGPLLGLFWTLFAIGEGVGGLAAPYLRRWRPWPVAVGVIAGWGICMLPAGLGDPVYLALAGFGIGGLIYAPFSAISMALFQRLTPPGSLVSVLAASQSIILIVPSAGVTLGGPLVTAVGARHTILLSGLATIGLAAIAGVVILLARALRPEEDLLPLGESRN